MFHSVSPGWTVTVYRFPPACTVSGPACAVTAKRGTAAALAARGLSVVNATVVISAADVVAGLLAESTAVRYSAAAWTARTPAGAVAAGPAWLTTGTTGAGMAREATAGVDSPATRSAASA